MLSKICVTLYTLTMAHLVKNLSALWGNWVWSLGWDDPLQKGMATHSSILAWKIPWTEEHGKLHFMKWQRHQHDWVTNTLHSHQLCTRVFTFSHLYWCLGNPDTNCCTSEVWEMVSPCGFTCLLVRLSLNLNLSWVWAGLKLSTKKKKNKNWAHDIWSHHFMANRRGKVEALTDFIFLGSKFTVDSDCSPKIKCLFLGRKAMTNLDSILKNRLLPTKVNVVNAMVFLPAVMWELDHKEGWVLKNCWFWTMLLEKSLESLWLQGYQNSQS